MENVLVSPSAPAEAKRAGVRDLLLFWYSLVLGSYGSCPPTKEARPSTHAAVRRS
jgi:hypothetical protein